MMCIHDLIMGIHDSVMDIPLEGIFALGFSYQYAWNWKGIAKELDKRIRIGISKMELKELIQFLLLVVNSFYLFCYFNAIIAMLFF